MSKYLCVKSLDEISENYIIQNDISDAIVDKHTGCEVMLVDEYEILWKAKSVKVRFEDSSSYFVCIGPYAIELLKSYEGTAYTIQTKGD